ncbi:hypothetical protein L2E82_01644 [Cichorium intybus]|uniref:Uncharacterized protein n=1 Tax=Cichorium intybus TaxID=13427 RepID=A0ACB9GZF6_CICIN|nr:hypothetical protein L2E82_01644 [Cichorium intybus]
MRLKKIACHSWNRCKYTSRRGSYILFLAMYLLDMSQVLMFESFNSSYPPLLGHAFIGENKKEENIEVRVARVGSIEFTCCNKQCLNSDFRFSTKQCLPFINRFDCFNSTGADELSRVSNYQGVYNLSKAFQSIRTTLLIGSLGAGQTFVLSRILITTPTLNFILTTAIPRACEIHWERFQMDD